MKHPWLRLGLRGAVVGSALVLGCSHGPCPVPSLPVAVPVAIHPGPSPYASEPVTRDARHAGVKILEVLPAGDVAEEQELSAAVAPPPPPPVVVRGACDEPASAAVPYGHAPDYRWLTGELRYSPARGAWCLRYAAGEDEDRHGGSVTLVGAGAMTGLRSGQAVRVEGEMIDPDTREPSGPYRVHSLRPLPPG
jgi:hypothetical protein